MDNLSKIDLYENWKKSEEHGGRRPGDNDNQLQTVGLGEHWFREIAIRADSWMHLKTARGVLDLFGVLWKNPQKC